MARASPVAPQRPTPLDLTPLTSALSNATDRLISTLTTARAEGKSAGEPTPPASATPAEVRVINKIPDTFLYVMKEQFAIMQSWMEPFAQVNARQDQQLNELGQTLQEIIARYDKVIKRLEQSAE